MASRVEGIIDATRRVTDEDFGGDTLLLSQTLPPSAPLTVAVHICRSLIPDTVPVDKRLYCLRLRRRSVGRPLDDFHLKADFLSDHIEELLLEFDNLFFLGDLQSLILSVLQSFLPSIFQSLILSVLQSFLPSIFQSLLG